MAKIPLHERVAALEERVLKLEGERSGRKALPIVTSEEGVCGIDPDCDSSKCELSSIYRHQQGCRGTACVEKTSQYYKDYRSKQAAGE